jgi:phosphoribosylformimino-5-aminoimidazole carboxamide ribotide isomerase
MREGDIRRIIPAIDMIGGRCVRLVQGDYARGTTYAEDPLEVALRFEEAGLRRLHLVDLDGARDGRVVHAGILERIVARTTLEVDFSGGIRSDDDLQRVFDAGATWACIGSLAVSDPARMAGWLDRHGDRLFIGADLLDGFLRVQGWQRATTTTIFDLVEAYGDRLRFLTCTDISRDGTLAGPAIALYRALRDRFPALQLIASGGVSGLDDVERLLALGLAGVIVGKAIYEGRVTLEALARAGRTSNDKIEEI